MEDTYQARLHPPRAKCIKADAVWLLRLTTRGYSCLSAIKPPFSTKFDMKAFGIPEQVLAVVCYQKNGLGRSSGLLIRP